MSTGSLGPGPRVCAHHPDRPGHALCMACRRVVCQECATEWDGINYCVECLAARRQAERPSSSILSWAVVLAALAFLFLLNARLMVWAGVFVATVL